MNKERHDAITERKEMEIKLSKTVDDMKVAKAALKKEKFDVEKLTKKL